MKHEFKHQSRFDTEINVDASKIKIAFEELGDEIGSKPFKGFIHELGADPFGYILLSHYQV